MKAIDQMERVNLRRIRAEQLGHAIFQKMRDYIPERDWQDAHYALFKVLCEEGVEVLTDHTRQEAGLPLRGSDGWTIEEIVALEKRRLELLNRLLVIREGT